MLTFITFCIHYNDITMSAIAAQITGISIVCSTVVSGTDQIKHQSSASLAFVRGIHRWTMNPLHKRPVTRKIFPFDDVIMNNPFNFEIFYIRDLGSVQFTVLNTKYTYIIWKCIKSISISVSEPFRRSIMLANSPNLRMLSERHRTPLKV